MGVRQGQGTNPPPQLHSIGRGVGVSYGRLVRYTSDTWNSVHALRYLN